MGLPVATPIAPIGRRGVAYFLDSLVVGIAFVGVAVVFDALFGPLVEATPDGTALVVVAVDPIRVALELTATLVIDALYFAGSWTQWGATPAQRALRLRVRWIGGQPSPPGARDAPPPEAAWRRWAVLGVVPLALGSLGASGALDVDVLVLLNGTWFLVLLVSTLADPLRRGLHDRFAGTVVEAAPGRPG
jgi:uncharacterized RDD family membrane protein YckC